MAFRDLIEGECGGDNSLVQLTSHFFKDAGYTEEGINYQQLESNQSRPHFIEDLHSNCGSNFKMDTLLSSMRNVETSTRERSLVHSHNNEDVPHLESVPVLQYQLPKNTSEYANQYLADDSKFRDFSDNKKETIWNALEDVVDPSWYSEYTFSQSEPFLNQEPRDYMNLINAESGNSFISDYGYADFETSEKCDGLRTAAREVVKTMEQDSQFENSQFLGMMRNISAGDSFNENLTETVPFLDETRNELEHYNKWAYETTGYVADEEELVNSMRLHNLQDEEDNNNNNGRISLEQANDSNHLSNNKEEPEVLGSKSEEDEVFSKELWEKLTKQWQELSANTQSAWDVHDDRLFKSMSEYTFAEQNPMMNITNALSEGKTRLVQGDWPGAVLCFEAAVQQDKNSAEAWLLLGKTQAENEQDTKAISALKNCLALDEKNLDALLSIAVSFTNENYTHQACFALKEWIKQNSKYNYLLRNIKDIENDGNVTSFLQQDFYDSVMGMYSKAINQQSIDEVDPDLLNAMGVLYTLNSDHEKAAEYFLSAVREKPDDARLWSRLGATLANGHKTDEAMEAYRSALKLSPGFIRGRYNLAIAYLHKNNHQEAIENLLLALVSQTTARGLIGEQSKSMSANIWSTLRFGLSAFNKQDLVPYAQDRNLEHLCKEFGISMEK